MEVQFSKRKFDNENISFSSNNDYKKIKNSNLSEKNVILDINLDNSITLNIDVEEEPYGQFVSTESLYYKNYSSVNNEINFQISPNKRFGKKH